MVEEDLIQLRKRAEKLMARRDVCIADADRLRNRVVELDRSVLEQNQVLKLLQAFADKLQHLVQDDVSKFVTEGVKEVFGKEKQFKLEFGLRSNQVVANMTLDDLVLNSQAGGVFAQSGGVLHVVSWLLRLWVVLRLSQAGVVGRVIFMDEPFGWLSPVYLPKICNLVSSLSKELGFSCIYITRDRDLIGAADTAYLAGSDDVKGVSLTKINLSDELP